MTLHTIQFTASDACTIPLCLFQIIECRRVLKWTYAYGYYLDDKVKSEFFEYLQGSCLLHSKIKS